MLDWCLRSGLRSGSCLISLVLLSSVGDGLSIRAFYLVLTDRQLLCIRSSLWNCQRENLLGSMAAVVYHR